MRKQMKQSLLNGLIQTFVSIIYFALAKLTGSQPPPPTTPSITTQAVFVQKKTLDQNALKLTKKRVISGVSKTSSCSASDCDDGSSSTSSQPSNGLIRLKFKRDVNEKNASSSRVSTASSWSTTVTSLSESSALTSSSDESYPSEKSQSQKKRLPTSNGSTVYYDYVDESENLVRVHSTSRLLQKHTVNAESGYIRSQSLASRIFRVKTILLFILFIVAYVCLNNYLIMFFYYKSYSASSSASTASTVLPSHHHRHRPAVSIGRNTSSSYYFLGIVSFSYILNALSFQRSVKATTSVILSQREIDELKLNESIEQFDFNNTIYLDPQDMAIAGLDFRDVQVIRQIHPDKLIILNDSYFDEELSSKTNLSSEITGVVVKEQRPCVHPNLNPYDSEIMQFVKKEADLKCNPKRNWIFVENGTIRVAKSAIKKHGTIVCAYIPLYRGNNDFSIYEGNRIFPVMDKMPLITDFFKIDCRSKDGAIYSNIHSGIAYESSLHMRHRWNPLPKRALGYNVLMFGFDSVSRMSWIRMLPKSYEYMIKLGFVVLKGYNIVGDGTPQALLPILTGHKETELPEARRGFANSSYVDSFPWVWKDFKNAGYVTQWAEDMQSIGTFQLRMMGFRKQPVDHYMRVFYLEAERYYTRFRRLCLGSISRHKNMLNWVRDFFQMYTDKPKFSFIFHSEASHNYNNPLSLLDDDLLEFLKFLKTSGAMDNTVLLFMSDHGVRVSDLRQFSQGKLEERLPFFSIRMPQSFQDKYPNEMRNLRLNSRKLTTPFDIHETFKDLLNFSPSSQYRSNGVRDRPSGESMPRGISLLRHIPTSRSCQDARIEAHWCSCLNWMNINITKTVSNGSIEVNGTAEPTVDYENLVEDTLDDTLIVSHSTNSENSSNVTVLQRFGRVKLDLNEYKSIQMGLQVYTKSTLKIARKAVEFMNSLIDSDFKRDCERIRLHSVQKLTKLELNRKLLTFKKSKDIHGREALFEEDVNSTIYANETLPSGASSIASLLLIDDDSLILNPLNTRNISVYYVRSDNQTENATSQRLSAYEAKSLANSSQNYQIVFQIALTTWPGNATYELSFKYNRFNGEFMFNKNEISRVNNYNSTSSCMLNKRPDLRQYCFCKYA